MEDHVSAASLLSRVGSSWRAWSHHRAPVLRPSHHGNNLTLGFPWMNLIFLEMKMVHGHPATGISSFPIHPTISFHHSLPCFVLSSLFWVAQHNHVMKDEVLRHINFKLSAALS